MSKQVRTAHVFEEKWRSKDVRLQEEADFSSLLLSERVLAGLEKNGFKVPSPIQIESIPVGRFGRDLVVQAKSGTGKTLVFTIIALEALLDIKFPQVLILAPTREIAVQVCDVIKSVGCKIKNLKCHSFIGGTPISKDIEKIVGCQIAVGTPGRIRQLIENGNLPIHSIRMFILDEADVLLETSFKSHIDYIFMTLPKAKQVIATSATYPKELKKFIRTYFHDAFLARLNVNKLALLGIVHYVQQVEASQMPHLAYQLKIAVLEKVLTTIQFTQCLVFCNIKSRVEPLCYDIRQWGFSTAFISSAKEQCERLKAIDCLKRFRCKVLVSSDVLSRGIDVENVDLIINFDKPQKLEIYLHRCGRAGRYGTKGVVITFLPVDEINAFERLKKEGNFQAYTLPDPVPPNLISIRPEGLDISDDESSENEDSKADLVKSVFQNGSIHNANVSNDPSSLSKQKIRESVENFIDEKYLVDGANSCLSNHVSMDSNESGINGEGIRDNQTLKDNNISKKSEKQSGIFEESLTQESEKDKLDDISNDFILSDASNDTIYPSAVAIPTKESESLNGVQLYKENDLYVCIKSKNVLHHETNPKDLNEVECENCTEKSKLNHFKEPNQKLQTVDNYGDKNLKVDDMKQSTAFVSTSGVYCEDKINSDIVPAAVEHNLGTSICETINNSLVSETPEADILSNACDSLNSLKTKLNDELSSKSLVLNKIQIPIVQFLINHSKNKNENNYSDEDMTAKNSSKVKSTSKGFLNTTKIVKSSQIKEVRKNLSDFYQKTFQSYQSKYVNEETCNEIKLKSSNAEKTDVFIDNEDVLYKKVVLHYKQELDVSTDSESTSSSLSSITAFKILEDFMFQGKESGKTKNKVCSSNSSTSSSDSSDSAEYFELHNTKRNPPTTELHASKQSSNKHTRMSKKQQNGLTEKLPRSNKSNLASGKIKDMVCSSNSSTSSSDSSDSAKYFELENTKRNPPTTELHASKQSSNKHSRMSKKQQNGLTEKLPWSNKSNLTSNISPYSTEDERQHGARRKTSTKNYQSRVHYMRKHTEASSSENEANYSYSKNFTKRLTKNNCVPEIKKIEVKSMTDTVKNHNNLPFFNSLNSHPCYYPHYPNDKKYVPQNSHCSTHQCHIDSSSFCFNDAYSDWYEIFYKQWMYIQMSSASRH